MCRLCSKYRTCTELCDKMLEILSNRKDGNGFYSDSISNIMGINFSSEILEKILYTHSLGDEEYSKVKKIIIAILTPEQKAILYLVSEGKNQREIADILCISQSGVSQKLSSIKKELKSQFAEIIDTIL